MKWGQLKAVESLCEEIPIKFVKSFSQIYFEQKGLAVSSF
jgi:hypothetical protein